MKIYFAGSIRGGRNDSKKYLEIINYLKKHGDVLTEHIGSKNINELGEQHLSSEEIYNRDLNWLEEADIVIGEVSTPSLGVGYEIAKAEKLEKKVLCVFQKLEKGKEISAMIKGNKNIVFEEYDDLVELFKIIDDFMINL
ncbi:MAG: nucleoside 2-deoxyribosyltransferase [Candidatus Paceibacterota bacterium]|jgi:nucleoside 2-deoxyribosyltransferase